MENTETVENTRRGRPSTYSKETIEAALAALKSGAKVKEVAKLTGMTTTSITYYKHRLTPKVEVSPEEALLQRYSDEIANLRTRLSELETETKLVKAQLTDASAKRSRVAKALGLDTETAE